MRRRSTSRHALCTAIAAAGLTAAPAAASPATNPGGASVPETPSVTAVTCADGRVGTCAKGAQLTLVGSALDGVRRVVFAGHKGKADDRSARPTSAEPDSLVITVPFRARSGPLVLDAGGKRVRAEKVVVTPPVAAAAGPEGAAPVAATETFPIAGKHTFGRTSANRFGGSRGHQGQDIFAKCGTPLIAAATGEVIMSAFQSAAGNYVVVQTADGSSHAYMHLRERSTLKEGDTVTAGERFGVVGQTGRASACHLHFELWTSPGWYKGGHAIDPLPTLRRWDRAS